MTKPVRKAAPWRLDVELLDRVAKAAAKLRRSQVDQVELILEDWLNKNEENLPVSTK